MKVAKRAASIDERLLRDGGVSLGVDRGRKHAAPDRELAIEPRRVVPDRAATLGAAAQRQLRAELPLRRRRRVRHRDARAFGLARCAAPTLGFRPPPCRGLRVRESRARRIPRELRLYVLRFSDRARLLAEHRDRHRGTMTIAQLLLGDHGAVFCQ